MSHPGGALGRKLLVRCGDIMHTGEDIPMCSSDVTIKEALLEMTAKTLGIVAVVKPEDQTLVGVYTDGDLRRTLEQEFSVHDKLSQVMTRGGITVKAQTLAADALTLMQHKKISAVIVVDDHNKVVGAFNMHDLLRAGLI